MASAASNTLARVASEIPAALGGVSLVISLFWLRSNSSGTGIGRLDGLFALTSLHFGRIRHDQEISMLPDLLILQNHKCRLKPGL